MLTNEDVIWLSSFGALIDYLSESNSVFFSFLFKMLFLYFLFMKLTQIKVFKKECMKLEYNIFYKQILCSFFWRFVCSDIHITKYMQMNT